MKIDTRAFSSILYLSLCALLSFFLVNTVNALPTPNFCFAFGDDGDTLHSMLVDGSAQSNAPNDAGVADIEAIAFSPFTNILYAADADTFGTLNYDFSDAINGGVFTPIGTFGSINGADGIITISDVDSLSFDPISGTLYGVDREDTADVQDRLFIIDVATGSADPDAFGAGVGYLVLSDNDPATDWDEDIDDLAIDPTDGRLYAIANSGGTEDHLITIDRTTGAITDLGVLNENDVEGLAFFNDGTLYATTGNNPALPTANPDRLWQISITSPPVATEIDQFSSDGDYEGVDCLVGDPNNKSGFVFNDLNNNGVFDGGEPPLQGIVVEIYRDDGSVNDTIDANDTFLTTATTDASGMYDFNMAAIGEFILQVDITSLPAGVSVSDNVEIANFVDCNPTAAPFDDYGCSEPDNNFPTVDATASDLQIEKTDDVDPVLEGTTVTYTITVTNNGPATATNVTVTDTFSGASYTVTGVSSSQGGCTAFPCNLGTLANGASATITITGTANVAGTIINDTSVSGDQTDSNPANNDAQETTLVTALTDADLQIDKVDDLDPVVEGTTVTYTITVTNNGPATATNVTVTDTFSGASYTVTGVSSSQGGCTAFPCNLGTLANGASATITITGTANVAGTIVNDTSVSGDQTDSNPANNDAQETTLVTTSGSEADLQIDKTDDLDPVLVGDTVTYTITVTNNGPATANNVTVTDTFSGASFTVNSVSSSQGGCTAFPCNLGTLANGASATITITGTANTLGTISNNADVSGDEPDINLANNSTQETTVVTDTFLSQSADPDDPAETTGVITSQGLVLTKLGDTTAVASGETVTFTITVFNPSAQPVPDVTIVDDLPAYYELISVTTSQGTASNTGNLVTVDIGTIQPQQTVTITIETETVRAGFSPDTCNSVFIGTDQSNTSCPSIFPGVLPQTGQSPLAPLRFLLIVLGLGFGTSLLIYTRFKRR